MLPPFLFSATADDAFRLPKTVAAESLALLSLARHRGRLVEPARFGLAGRSRAPPGDRVRGAPRRRDPARRVFAVHPEHWRRAAVGTAIALACLVLWSARLPERTLRRALDLLVVPAVALASLAILQFFDLFRPFAFARAQALRYQLTSVAGSVGDLAAFLVLPALVLQAALLRARRTGARVAIGVLLAVMAYTLFLSQTLAALLAITVATVLFWALVLPRRRWWLLGAPLVLVVLAASILPGLNRRVEAKYREVKDGKYDSLLSGRPDGWKASLEMFREHPFFGVGHGGYGSSFAPAKLALAERGADLLGTRADRLLRQRAQRLSRGPRGVGAVGRDRVGGGAPAPRARAPSPRSRRAAARIAPSRSRGARVRRARAGVVSAAHRAHRLSVAVARCVDLRRVRAAAHRRAEARRAMARPTTSAHGGVASRCRRAPGRRRWCSCCCRRSRSTSLSLLGRLHASRIVRTTGQVAQLALAQGEAAARPMLQANLQPLRYAAELDPLAIGVPLTTGSHYLLLGNGNAAVESYEHGLAIEPRAEIYFNLARALLFLGRRDQAVAHADTALDARSAARATRPSTLGLREAASGRAAAGAMDRGERARGGAPARAPRAHTLGEVSTTLTVRIRIVQSSHKLQLAM